MRFSITASQYNKVISACSLVKKKYLSPFNKHKNKNDNNTNPEGGYTLFELLLILTILGLLASVVIPNVFDARKKMHFTKLCEEIRFGLSETRERAMEQNREAVFWLHLKQKKWRVESDPWHKIPNDVRITLKTALKEAVNIQLAGIRFLGDGSSSGGQLRLQKGDHIMLYHIDWLTGKIQSKQIF